jgi:hypothetical protein
LVKSNCISKPNNKFAEKFWEEPLCPPRRTSPQKGEKEEEKDSFLKNQQKELFQFIRDQEAKKNWDKAKADKNKT